MEIILSYNSIYDNWQPDLYYIIKNKPLWKYESPIISGDFAELLIAFVVFPCTCFIFFQLYSKVNNSKRIPVYILFFLFCAFVYTSIEYLSFYLGFFSHHNSWNIYWSFAVNLTMFPLLLLHYKKPLWVWFPSIACAFLVIYRFNLPFFILK